MATTRKRGAGKRPAARASARAARRPAARAKKVAPVPPQYGSVTPQLHVRGASSAIDFYRKAFGAKELMRMPGPGGVVMHAEIKIGDSIVMLNDEFPDQGARSPQSLGGTAGAVLLYVKDVDQIYRRAIDAGARSLMAPQDMFWGDRYSRIEDPFGHHWAIATAKEKVTPKEMKRRMAAMPPPGSAPPSP